MVYKEFLHMYMGCVKVVRIAIKIIVIRYGEDERERGRLFCYINSNNCNDKESNYVVYVCYRKAFMMHVYTSSC
jgi:hypothetical protein